MIERVFILLAATTIAAGAFSSTGVEPARAETVEPTLPKLLGLATDDFREDFPQFTALAGKGPALHQIFWRLELEWPNIWSPAMLEDIHDLGATPYVEITADDLDGLNSGAYDQALAGLVGNVAEWMSSGPDRRILVAPLPEANLGAFGWGGDPDGYKAGFARIRQAFLDQGLGEDVVRFVFAMNGPGDDIYGYEGFYPGHDLVDIVGFSKLNRGSPWRDYETTFAIHIEEMKEAVGPTKPIIITQTASVEEGGDRDQWIEDMFTGLGADDQVIGAVYFNRLKEEGSVLRDYRVLVDGVLNAAFKGGYDGWSDPSATSWLFDGRLEEWSASISTPAAIDRPIFSDIGDSIFEADIVWLAEAGITKGCAEDRFCPSARVTRGQMAAFLVRALDLPPGGSGTFTDDDGSIFEQDIESLSAAGITAGCAPSAFCPEASVTRAQMAAFLRRALQGELAVNQTAVDFTDDDGSVFEADIEWLSMTGVTSGCAVDRFCPDDAVTRGQMAAFLHRALGG